MPRDAHLCNAAAATAAPIEHRVANPIHPPIAHRIAFGTKLQLLGSGQAPRAGGTSTSGVAMTPEQSGERPGNGMGCQLGSPSNPGLVVSLLSSLPSAFITLTSSPPKRPSPRVNAIS